MTATPAIVKLFRRISRKNREIGKDASRGADFAQRITPAPI